MLRKKFENRNGWFLIGILFLLSSAVSAIVGIITANYGVFIGVILQFLAGIMLVINNNY